MSVLKLAAVFANRRDAQAKTSEERLTFNATADPTDHLPFASLVLSAAPDLVSLNEQSCVGLYLISERAMLNRPLDELSQDDLPASVGIFPMIAKPSLDALSADNHWREIHGPLALQVHSAMTHYYQLQIVHRFFGPAWHGLALCCFDSEQALREKMYNSAEGKRQITEDILTFADTKNSPRKVVAEVAKSARS
jgi:hypothetical protein